METSDIIICLSPPNKRPEAERQQDLEGCTEEGLHGGVRLGWPRLTSGGNYWLGGVKLG